MVKAFSYGLGTYEVAQVLEKEGVDYLGVANILEGVEIRKAGVQTPIMVMNPETASFNLMIKHQLTPVIFSIHNLHLFAKKVEKSKQLKPYPIHIKIDTGMHRLGIQPEEMDVFITELKKLSHLIKIESVFLIWQPVMSPHMILLQKAKLLILKNILPILSVILIMKLTGIYSIPMGF